MLQYPSPLYALAPRKIEEHLKNRHGFDIDGIDEELFIIDDDNGLYPYDADLASAWERYEILKNIDDIKTYIKELECDYIKLANTIIYERERYKNSISNGQGIIEADTQDKAYQEIQNLSLEIFK